MGGRTVALLRFLLRATKWMHRDGYAVLASRLRGLQMDLGSSFQTELQRGEVESSLTITRCIYHDIFSAEGKPQLAFTSCCSQDKVWFEHPAPHVEAAISQFF
ncbi:hypothetical protein C2E20_3605 [Micractinium conductrix]|uniref:Uncharacterized protein n=1 Tax=Micractinium conductrix TaxID=554055 RepID=A0A2P6VFW7_9CHLO|nr:hypothetical protein C2E20_3605 [Micractinium conductrix]|eukprot:PSC72984.1 hypothetical protein C2E20_3605 [Micractinium conductrix]